MNATEMNSYVASLCRIIRDKLEVNSSAGQSVFYYEWPSVHILGGIRADIADVYILSEVIRVLEGEGYSVGIIDSSPRFLSIVKKDEASVVDYEERTKLIESRIVRRP